MLVLSVFSLLVLILIHWTFSKYDCSITASGLKTYLSGYGAYKELFSGTIATIAVYFGLLRLKAAVDANILKFKNDEFAEWKLALEARITDLQSESKIKRVFIENRKEFFNRLFKLNFKISNKDELEKVFEPFASLINFIEETTEKYMQMGGVYLDNKYSYSSQDFIFLFFGGLSSDGQYSGIVDDLQELYVKNLKSDRRINANEFEISTHNRLRRS
jgi:hypothetical protein